MTLPSSLRPLVLNEADGEHCLLPLRLRLGGLTRLETLALLGLRQPRSR